MSSSATKATVEEIRKRFDGDVERFSNLETGQAATVDAPLAMELICQAAAAVTPEARDLLDIGCGAGNYSVKMLQQRPGMKVTLVDLSQPMLTKASERVLDVTKGDVATHQADIRDLDLQPGSFDIVLTAATLHHLRSDEEWEAVFQKIYDAIRPGGSFWIFDLVLSSATAIDQLMWTRYANYLTDLKDEDYQKHVFDYIAYEDTPRPLMEQIDLLRKVGFTDVDILHKNSCFAAFGGLKR
ncbi:class I SAM-dependent methyltransferase [Rubinisphaera margarita]|uniref:class I SAM-dependent methyltransferase n=1 Tax=Rubinisphaera margarita TaxID=2909586 RepID=UPI001EE97D10|nr:class I SAM-dependent methyltransferase [Rubinisphaera margarita]MCG6154407.1 methyltransferase domain-containing protein [Rubinisphaera margarita]